MLTMVVMALHTITTRYHPMTKKTEAQIQQAQNLLNAARTCTNLGQHRLASELYELFLASTSAIEVA